MLAQLQLVTDTDSTNAREAAAENWATFETFWEMYPRRVAKLEAKKAWIGLSSAQCVEAITAMVNWRKVWMARGELEFVPHAATWLRGERWEDDLPMPKVSAPLSASHVTAALPKLSDRTAMPDSVRELLAKLRK